MIHPELIEKFELKRASHPTAVDTLMMLMISACLYENANLGWFAICVVLFWDSRRRECIGAIEFRWICGLLLTATLLICALTLAVTFIHPRYFLPIFPSFPAIGGILPSIDSRIDALNAAGYSDFAELWQISGTIMVLLIGATLTILVFNFDKYVKQSEAAAKLWGYSENYSRLILRFGFPGVCMLAFGLLHDGEVTGAPLAFAPEGLIWTTVVSILGASLTLTACSFYRIQRIKLVELNRQSSGSGKLN